MAVDGVREESLRLQKAMGEATREPVGGTSRASHLNLEGRKVGIGERHVHPFLQAWDRSAALIKLSKRVYIYQAYMPMSFPFQAYLQVQQCF